MLLKVIAQIIFLGLIFILAILTVIMVYVLLRFGQSKVLALILSIFYVLLMTSLYAAAVANFNQIPFGSFDL